MGAAVAALAPTCLILIGRADKQANSQASLPAGLPMALQQRQLNIVPVGLSKTDERDGL